MAASKAKKPDTVRCKVAEGRTLDLGRDPKTDQRKTAGPGDLVTLDADEAERLADKGFVVPEKGEAPRELDASSKPASAGKPSSAQTGGKAADGPPPIKGENETAGDGQPVLT